MVDAVGVVDTVNMVDVVDKVDKVDAIYMRLIWLIRLRLIRGH